MSECYLDVILQKSGPELFKELYRLYPLAEVEDYFKSGQWQDELLRMDCQVIYAHREEAGSPDPPDLSDIEFPKLPAGQPAMGLRMPGVVSTPSAPPAQAVAELQLMVHFANKHKLDLVKTKTMLSVLPVQIRRSVMSTFAPKGSEEESLSELETFINEKKASAPAGVAAAGTAPVNPGMASLTTIALSAPAISGQLTPVAPKFGPATVVAALQPVAPPVRPVAPGRPVAPLVRTVAPPVWPVVPQGAHMMASKRPIGPPSGWDPSKRPRMVTPRVGGARPWNAGGVRPWGAYAPGRM